MVATQATVVLHPAAEDIAEQHALAPRLPHLQGATVGLIDNHKKNADVYLEELGRQLQNVYGVSRLVTYRKVSQSLPTPSDVLDQLASECDAIIHAVADWGSCTAWGLHDGIEAEKRGRAAATVITQGFVKAAEIRAQALGMPAHPVVVIDHPIASKSREQILELARKSVDEVARHLMSSMQGAPHE